MQPETADSTSPLLSIIIPFRNAASSIGDTISSILQSAEAMDESLLPTPWLQLIFVDNSSTDDSSELLRGVLSAWEPKSGIIFNCIVEPLLGVSNARNCGLSQSLGQYIGFIDADDTIDVSFFHELLNGISFQSDIIYIQNNEALLSGNRGLVAAPCTPEYFIVNHLDGWQCWSFITKADLLRSCKFSGDCYEDFGLFPLLLGKSSSVSVIQGRVYNYNQSSQGLTSKSLIWRSGQWEKQYENLRPRLYHIPKIVYGRVYHDYLCNKIVLRSLAGLPPVLGLGDSFGYLFAAYWPFQLISRFCTLIYRNAVAVRQFVRMSHSRDAMRS